MIPKRKFTIGRTHYLFEDGERWKDKFGTIFAQKNGHVVYKLPKKTQTWVYLTAMGRLVNPTDEIVEGRYETRYEMIPVSGKVSDFSESVDRNADPEAAKIYEQKFGIGMRWDELLKDGELNRGCDGYRIFSEMYVGGYGPVVCSNMSKEPLLLRNGLVYVDSAIESGGEYAFAAYSQDVSD